MATNTEVSKMVDELVRLAIGECWAVTMEARQYNYRNASIIGRSLARRLVVS